MAGKIAADDYPMKTNINPNEESCSSQKARILEHMRKGHSITPVEALNLYGSLRLGARIAEIRSAGYTVHMKLVKDEKTGKRYAQYSM